MAGWGSAISSVWGSGGEVAGTLWLYLNRDVPIIRAIGEIIDDRHQRLLGVLRQIEVAFDLDVALGVVLDIFGALLGLQRNGLSDARYRRALRVQRSLILSSAGTRQALLDVFESWTEAAALEYYTGHPNAVIIGGVVASLDESLLLRFLRAAAPGGRQVAAYTFEADYLIADYALDPLGETSVTDYGLDPIAGAAITAGRIQ